MLGANLCPDGAVRKISAADPALLAHEGRALVRISDARVSGTSYGAVVLHVAPESVAGGSLGLVRGGDLIRLDVRSRTLDLLAAEPVERLAMWERPARKDPRGFRRLHREHVLQADHGCDFDFLRGRSAVVSDAVTYR